MLYRGDDANAYKITDAFVEEMNGDVVIDAVYGRNLLMEEKYGIKFVKRPEKSPTETAVRETISGDQSYDVMIDCMITGFPRALENYFYDFNKLTYLDIADPWWDANISRDLTVAGHLFLIAGDVTSRPICDARFIYFSKGIMDVCGIDYPYDMVREGTWTIDRMIEMVTKATADLDGNGIITADDRVGFLEESSNNFLTGCGVVFTENDEYGIPDIACINERTVAALEKVQALFGVPNCTLTYEDAASGRDTNGYPHIWEYVRSVFFAGNHFLFVQNGAGESSSFRDMEPGYGVLPNPKLDEKQENYYHLVDPYSCAWFMPSDPADAAFTDMIFTAWAYHSGEVREAYFEKTLKYKRMDAPDDSEMLDLIFRSMRYEVSTLCDLGISGMLVKAFKNGSLISTYEKDETAINKKLNDLADDILALGN